MQLRDTTHFTTRFLLPIVAAAGITVLALAGFLAWSAQKVDQQALARDQQLLERGFQELKTQMAMAMNDFVIWDENVDAAAIRDTDYLVENLGVYAYENFDYGRVFVLDRKFRPMMAVRDGGVVPAESSAGALADLRPIFETFRSLDSLAKISAYNSGVQEKPPLVTDFVTFEGKPALLGVMPILSHTGDNSAEVGTEALSVSLLMLDADLAFKLGHQYRIANPAFTDEAPAEGAAAITIYDANQNQIAWLTWEPQSPGARLIEAALPALGAALAIGIVIIGLLLASLRSALNQLNSEREEASHRALHDPLTGLGNRSLFETKLAESFRSMPKGQPRLAMLALDLDKFKQVNDTMGHQAGDELLVQVAARLKPLLGPEDTLIRLGGDEFSVIMPNITDHEAPKALAGAIIEALSRPVNLAAGTAAIGVSVGIATAPDQAHEESELVRCADEALYRAKNGGRNRYCIYSEEAGNEPARREAKLRDSFIPAAVSA
jgi:diguanylate cyclase (GGDEF)-like protein